MHLVTDPRFSKNDADPLRSFCGEVSNLDSIDPVLLAGFFAEFFGIPWPLRLGDIRKIAETCGIKVEELSIPMRGYWQRAPKNFMMFCRRQDSEFRQMFTLLHEVREVMQSIFRQTDPQLRACREWEAETFAGAVIGGAGLVRLSNARMVLVRLEGESCWGTLLLWTWVNIFRAPLLSECRDYLWEVLRQLQAQSSNELMESSFPNSLLFMYARAPMNLRETWATRKYSSCSWPAEIEFCSRLRLRLFICGYDLETGKREQQNLTVRGTNFKNLKKGDSNERFN